MKKPYTDPIYIGKGATERLKKYVEEHFTGNFGITVCDENTVKYTGTLPTFTKVIFPDGVVATDTDAEKIVETVKETEEFFKKKAGYLIACGSGTVHDLTRFAAHKMHMPFISFPTAASVDGFVSSIAAMTIKGRKDSVPSTPPVALFADNDVYEDAPMRLTASGVGDIVGKYTSLLDWRISSILGVDPMDEEIFTLEENTVEDVMKLRPADEGYVEKVMKCLVTSGMCIQYYGNSRPASGSEHHLSHLWEMKCINEETGALHGEQVGVSTLIVLEKYKKALKEGIHLVPKAHLLNHAYLEPVYGKITDGIIEENTPNPLDTLTENDIASHCDAIASLVEKLPSAEYIRNYMISAGCKTTLSELGLPDTAEFAARTLEFAVYARKRLTLLRII